LTGLTRWDWQATGPTAGPVKFFSSKTLLQAAMDRTGTNEATINMGRVIGEGYKKGGGGCPETTTHATVVRGPKGIITAYPNLDP
jgi:hypothetical protein